MPAAKEAVERLLLALLPPLAVPAGVFIHAIAGGVSCCAAVTEWELLASSDCTLLGAVTGGVNGIRGAKRGTDRSASAAGATVWPAVGIFTAGLATGAGSGESLSIAENRVAAVGTNPALADLPEEDSSHGLMLPDDQLMTN